MRLKVEKERGFSAPLQRETSLRFKRESYRRLQGRESLPESSLRPRLAARWRTKRSSRPAAWSRAQYFKWGCDGQRTWNHGTAGRCRRGIFMKHRSVTGALVGDPEVIQIGICGSVPTKVIAIRARTGPADIRLLRISGTNDRQVSHSFRSLNFERAKVASIFRAEAERKRPTLPSSSPSSPAPSVASAAAKASSARRRSCDPSWAQLL